MKMIRTCVLILLSAISAWAQAPKKIALIVAIGDYPEETEWGDISSEFDVPLVKAALTGQGFTDITVIRDKEASKDGILKAMLALKNKAAKGDVVAIHFSSHGQQIADDNGDELDGLDEAIVAWGAPMRYYEGYKGEKHLRDDEIGALLLQIRSQVGSKGDVVMFLDACHSGTAHRGKAKVRGGKDPLIPPGYVKKTTDKQTGMLESGTTRGNDGNLAPFVVFSAARAEQLNSETEDEKGNGVGSLSFALSKCMQKINKNTTYRSLYASLLAEMTVLVPGQDPVVEGNIDRKLFADDAVPAPSYYTIENINDSRSIVLKGGNITGIYDGTEIAVFRQGSDLAGKPVATGTVKVAQNITSMAELDKALPTTNKNDWWVVVTRKTFGDVKVNVQLGSFSNPATRSEVEKVLAGLSGIVTVVNDKGDLMLGQPATRGSAGLSLTNMTDFSEVGKIEKVESGKVAGQVEEMLQQYIQGKFIKQMELSNSKLDVSFELIPVKMENGKVTDTLDISKYLNNGALEMPTDVKALVRVTNNGIRDAYFNIIDIQPDGIINGILPDPAQNQDPKDFRIKAGQSAIVSDYFISFAPPYGNEVFKLFASYEPIDLKPIITARGHGTRGNDPLSSLFSESYNIVGTRGGNSSKLSAQSDANTFNYAFKIVPPKN